MAKKTTRDDRLSTLGDAALTRILSHLPTDEAVRTSILSRRWRNVYATVPVVDVVDPKIGDRCRGYNTLPMCYEQKVTCALMSRDPTAPIRVLRIDVYHPTHSLLDQWIPIALRAGAEEVDVKVRCQEASRLRLCPFIPYEGASADFDGGDLARYIRTPRSLFHSATLRHLSLSRWTLEFPKDVSSFMPLETLALHRVMGSAEALQRLVSRCNQLKDLTLEECPGVKKLTVTSASLRTLALVCCHNTRSIVIHSRRLRSLRYKGGVPPTRSFFSIANHAAITAVTIDICQDIGGKTTPTEIASVTELIGRCGNLEFLHLSLRPAMAYYSSLFTSVLRCLPYLRHLELRGCLRNDHSVGCVSVLLQNTPNLQVFLVSPSSRPYREEEELPLRL
ncbi:hypothetical protein PR202_ga07632 [Eleusine coracana subsp. coracana]|uniref:F-box domain-containing protein n=1 Tax=Eleusine coracana subsp. coracana TaxID=191504 RepID=A0AAV5C0H8_ELECO|nr:hypothetical protein PR202_ga07632 [Eleusine coracana subsp. coracana]